MTIFFNIIFKDKGKNHQSHDENDQFVLRSLIYELNLNNYFSLFTTTQYFTVSKQKPGISSLKSS